MAKRKAAYALIALVVTLALLVYLAPWQSRPSTALDSPAIVREIRALQELASVQFSIQKVIGFREPRPFFGEESLLLVVQGRVVAGVDLTELKPQDVFRDSTGVTFVRLPKAKVLHVYLDEKQTQVWDRRVTWWTPWIPPSPDLETRARQEALQGIEKTALEMSILPQSEKNAQAAIRHLLRAFTVENVSFRAPS